MRFALLLVVATVLSGCAGTPPSTATTPDLETPTTNDAMLTGFTSPCVLDGWRAASSGICARAWDSPLAEGAMYTGQPAIAFDEANPQRIAVAAMRLAADLGTLPRVNSALPDHTALELFLSEDGGETWIRSIVPAHELFYGAYTGDDVHAYPNVVVFDSQGRLHVFASVHAITDTMFLAPPPDEGVLHAWSDDGVAWQGQPLAMEPGAFGRIAAAWDEGGRLFALYDQQFQNAATLWASDSRGAEWTMFEGYQCNVTVEDGANLARDDLRDYGPGLLACPQYGHVYRLHDNFTASPAAELPTLLCGTAWVVPLSHAHVSAAAYQPCWRTGVLVQPGPEQPVGLVEFIGREPGSRVYSIESMQADGRGNAVMLSRSTGAVAGESDQNLQPWLTAVDGRGDRAFTASLVGPDEFMDDPASVNPIELGSCAMALAEPVVVVACTEHDPALLRLFRLQLSYE